MYSRSEKLWVAGALIALVAGSVALAAARQPRTGSDPAPGGTVSSDAAPPPASQAGSLRVCADPNNLPFTNEAGEGFENALAELVAEDLGVELEYTWQPQRRGFIRTTLRAGKCDVVMGVPSSFELAQPTNPYYRSTYVFVQRADAGHRVTSMDDPALRTLRVGVPVVGDDYSSTPGAAALGRRGIIENVKGYSVYGDYDQPHPPSRIIDAVADGEIDLAIAWGPLAGYFAAREDLALELTPVSPQIDPPFTPFVFDIAMAVRRGEDSLRARLDDVLERRRPEIRRLLEEYGVPLVATGADRRSAAREETRP